MNKNKLQFIDLFNDRLEKDDFENLCMSEEEIKDYENGQRDPYIIFEGDPDYMIDENGGYTYFIRIKDKVYYIGNEYGNDDLDKLQEFINGQNPKVSISGTCSRLETKNRKYFEDENYSRDGFNNYKGLKIAYRNGCGYTYALFKYE